MSGAASGASGTVVGKSGRFAEHVICHFPAADIERMAPGDRIQIRAFGVGLRLLDFPEIDLKNSSPELLAMLDVSRSTDGKLAVPVKATVPGVLGGAGAGFSVENAVVNLQTSDPQLLLECGLEDLRFGDVVAITDWDSRYAHGYLRGAVGVGIVCQGASYRSGYGPGMTIIMTSRSGSIAPVVTDRVNIADLLELH
jgi:hypothetical protein